ncbi:MAG: DNA gyrase subunit B, partial [Campylobacter hyointestinalis]
EAIITKFARLKDKNLPNKAVIYTRNLTKIWICFFMINAIVTLIFGFIDERLWLIYCGFVSYVLVFLLFVVEILYRKFFIK